MWKFSAIQLVDPTNLPQSKADNDTYKVILTDFFILLGAFCLLIVVISGFRYILARGNPDTVKSARNSLAYALIGLVLAAMAATIVNVILNHTGDIT